MCLRLRHINDLEPYHGHSADCCSPCLEVVGSISTPVRTVAFFDVVARSSPTYQVSVSRTAFWGL